MKVHAEWRSGAAWNTGWQVRGGGGAAECEQPSSSACVLGDGLADGRHRLELDVGVAGAVEWMVLCGWDLSSEFGRWKEPGG